ncbi:MAG: T9SS type A sorting domain-containing protein, partial [Ignavibacteria bacterium]|nr:T9SS type A sorting domain-containing protein [Ignavibacteria bacterium]
NQAVMLAGLGHTRNQVGSLYGYLYISGDSGKTWTNAMPDVKTLPIKAVHIKADGTIFAVGQGIFRSTDHGVTFQTVNTGFRDMLSTGSGFAINSKDHLFYSSNNGVFKSTDLGETWKNANNGLTRPIVNTLFVDSYDNVFAALYSGNRLNVTPSANLFISTDDGNTWDTVNISIDNQYFNLAEAPDGKLYCSHGFGAKPPALIIGSSLAVSSDHGVTWTDLDVKAGAGFSVAVNKRGHIFHGGETDGPFRSTDGGVTWDTDLSVGGMANIAPIAISPNDEIFCNSYGLNQLWFSDSLSNGKPMLNMTSLTFPQYHSPTAFAWGKNDRMYVTTRSQSSPSGLFYADPPWSVNTTFTAVSGIPVSPFAMAWDSQGYLWMQGVGFMAKSDSVLGIVNIQCTLPVELTSFTAAVKTSLIELNWRTATEVNNYGFEVEKIVGGSQPAKGSPSPNTWVKIGFVQGSGNSNSPKEYSFIEANPVSGKSYYRLKMIDMDGSFEYSKEVEINTKLPSQFVLHQNYPNPFNPETMIEYSIPETGHAPSLQTTLKVYDVLGKEIVTLVDELKESGTHSANFDASIFSSGVYFYKLQAGSFLQIKKMLLIR